MRTPIFSMVCAACVLPTRRITPVTTLKFTATSTRLGRFKCSRTHPISRALSNIWLPMPTYVAFAVACWRLSCCHSQPASSCWRLVHVLALHVLVLLVLLATKGLCVLSYTRWSWLLSRCLPHVGAALVSAVGACCMCCCFRPPVHFAAAAGCIKCCHGSMSLWWCASTCATAAASSM